MGFLKRLVSWWNRQKGKVRSGIKEGDRLNTERIERRWPTYGWHL